MNLQYKNVLLLLICFVSFTSCFELRFTSTFPTNQKNLTSFPEEMIGSYRMVPIPNIPKTEQLLARQYVENGKTIDSIKFDSLVIRKHSFKFPMLRNEFSIIDSIGELRQLNDTCFIFSKKSVKPNDETWALFPFTFINNRITVYSSMFLPKEQHEIIIDSIKQYTSITPIYKIVEGKKRGKIEKKEIIEYWLVDATQSEFENLISNGIFPKFIEFDKNE